MKSTTLALLALACASWGSGQESPTATPLRITNVKSSLTPNGRSALTLDVENVSSKAIAAYVLNLELRDPATGRLLSRLSTSVFTKGIVPSAGHEPYAPTKSWSHSMPMNQHALSAYQTAKSVFVVDLVVFEDGTTWGPDKSGSFQRILGMKEGAAAENALQTSKK
jgi:hypothetical protein